MRLSWARLAAEHEHSKKACTYSICNVTFYATEMSVQSHRLGCPNGVRFVYALHIGCLAGLPQSTRTRSPFRVQFGDILFSPYFASQSGRRTYVTAHSEFQRDGAGTRITHTNIGTQKMAYKPNNIHAPRTEPRLDCRSHKQKSTRAFCLLVECSLATPMHWVRIL